MWYIGKSNSSPIDWNWFGTYHVTRHCIIDLVPLIASYIAVNNDDELNEVSYKRKILMMPQLNSKLPFP